MRVAVDWASQLPSEIPQSHCPTVALAGHSDECAAQRGVSALHAERCETQRSHRSTLTSYYGSDQSVSAAAVVTGWPVDSAWSVAV